MNRKLVVSIAALAACMLSGTAFAATHPRPRDVVGPRISMTLRAGCLPSPIQLQRVARAPAAAQSALWWKTFNEACGAGSGVVAAEEFTLRAPGKKQVVCVVVMVAPNYELIARAYTCGTGLRSVENSKGRQR